MPNVFTGDLFSNLWLAQRINTMPYVPTFFGEMNLFNDRVDGVNAEQMFTNSMANGINSKTVSIRRENGTLMVLPTEARGSMPTYNVRDKICDVPFLVPYIPKNDDIRWDDIIGTTLYGNPRPGTGELDPETATMAVERVLKRIKYEYILTWEYHRLGAVKGLIMDADGQQTVLDLYKAFQIEQIDSAGNTTPGVYGPRQITYTNSLAEVSEAIVSHVGDVLGSMMPGEIGCVVGADFFTKIQDEVQLRDAFDRYKDGEFRRTSYDNMPYQRGPNTGFHYRGVTYYRYRGNLQTQDKDNPVKTPFVANDRGHTFVRGTDRYSRYNAPGTCEDAVGKLGIPIYVTRQDKDFKKGIDFHAESCPLFMNGQPEMNVEVIVA